MSKNLVIDLTPLLPGGINGGAKLVALNLIKDLQKYTAVDCNWRVTLLTAPWNQAELEQYTSDRITYKLLEHLTQGHYSLSYLLKKVRYKIYQLPLFPSLLTQLEADLLFCPFSNPILNPIPVPCVSILHDIQHWQYPQFFSTQELKHRQRYLKRMIQYSDLIICVSHFSERSLHQYCHQFNLSPKATTVIYNYFKATPKGETDQFKTNCLEQLQFTPYLLYPANYWPHKNHRLLLESYAQYLQWYQAISPEYPCLQLVLTGSLEAEERQYRELTKQLQITDSVHFLGYLDDRSFEDVWEHCEGLIFPSLYEGFGLPIVEAMERSKPILCSQIPCLEEVTAGACLYFDPSQIQSISNALRSFTLNLELRQDLKQQSQKRYEYFQNLNPIQDYLSVFENVLRLRNK